MRAHRLEPLFVEEIPVSLDPDTLYVSIEFATALHLCVCGCGNEVVTPLHPTRWRLIYDGHGVSLYPSVGSASLPCRSHYFIRDNRVRWAPWSKQEAEKAQARDRAETAAFFVADRPTDEPGVSGARHERRRRTVGRLWHWLLGK